MWDTWFDRFEREREKKEIKKKDEEAREINKEEKVSLSRSEKKKKEKSAHLLLSSCTPQVYVDTWPRRRHLRGRLD